MSHYYRTTTACQTGTKVTTGHADDLGVAVYDDGTIWWTRCEEHGEVMGYPTLALAKRHAAYPLGWCESCMDLADQVRAKAEAIIEAERIDVTDLCADAPTPGPFVDVNADEAELRDLRRRGVVRMDGGWMVPNIVV